MASSSGLNDALKNSGYVNLLKVGLSLRELQKGLLPVLKKHLDTVRKSVLDDIKPPTNDDVAYCGSCTSANILLHNPCRVPGCVCRKDLGSRRRACPTGTCGNFCLQLDRRYGGFGSPQMQNVDFSGMYTDCWQVGKAYLPASGYMTTDSADECDATGILSIIINCAPIAIYIGVAICKNPPKDIFSQVKDIRNRIMHSVSLEVTDSDMETALDKMVEALRTAADFDEEPETRAAAQEIDELKRSSIQVPSEIEQDLLREKLTALQEAVVEETSKRTCLGTSVSGIKQKLTELDTRNKRKIDIYDRHLRQQKKRQRIQEKAIGRLHRTVRATIRQVHTVMKTDENGWTDAHHAAADGNEDLLRTLLEEVEDVRIDPISRTRQNQTLLHLAALNGRYTIVKYLCENYPELLPLTDTSGWSAAHFATVGGHLDCLKLLFLTYDMNQSYVTAQKQTLLHLAAKYWRQTIVETLLDEYPEMIKQVDDNLWNCGHYAASAGDMSCLSLLLERGLDHEARTRDKKTLLHLAAENGRKPVVEVLAVVFPDMTKATDDNQRTAVQIAASEGHVDCLQTFLDLRPELVTGLRPGHSIRNLLTLAEGNDQILIAQYLLTRYPYMIFVDKDLMSMINYIELEMSQFTPLYYFMFVIVICFLVAVVLIYIRVNCCDCKAD